VSKLIFCINKGIYSIFLFGNEGTWPLFKRGRLNLVLVLDNSSICITSDDTRIIHKVGPIEALRLS
jgi:hypothetical protein